jgi:uncharacterized membrane protein
MTLLLPLLAMFVFIGLTQTALSRKAYLRMGLVILVVLAYYYFTYTPDF